MSRSMEIDTLQLTASKYLAQEVLNNVPSERASAFQEALRENRELVEYESDPHAFLRTEDAAFRVCRYWENRKRLFGDRWLRPIVFNEDGALTSEEIKIAESGIIAILPNDNCLRPIILIDLSRVPSTTEEQRDRVLFWVFQRISSNPKSQEDGVVLLIQLVVFEEDILFLRRVLDFTHNFPVKVRNSHFITRATNQVPPPPEVLPADTYFHIVKSKADGRKKLGALALSEPSIPRAYGGRWSYEVDFRDLMLQEKEIATQSQADLKVARVTSSSEVSSEDDVSIDGKPSAKSAKDESPDDYDRDRHLKEFNEAMASISDECKKEYITAHKTNPSLFELDRECDPMLFVRCEKGKAAAAAKRMCVYWNQRRKYFGERASLPLIQTGKGALTEKECTFLYSSFNAILPDDGAGNIVIFQDSGRVPPDITLIERRRTYFYLVAALCRWRPRSIKGVRYMLLVNGNEQRITLSIAEDHVTNLKKSSPLPFQHVHLLTCTEFSKGRSFFEYIFPQCYNILTLATKNRVSVHTGPDPSSLGRQLQALGLKLDGIPPRIGGNWNYSNHELWLRDRLKNEIQLFHPEESLERLVVGYASNVSEALGAALGLPESEPSPDEPEDVDRYKNRRAVYSRRQRKRQKAELNRLNEEYVQLSRQNTDLKRENERLEMLVQSAHREIQRVEGYHPQADQGGNFPFQFFMR